ncbi:MAG: hypothetical protein CMD92_09845 [Gammaproteobacteria bacterium]|nr:hypothetical protein [Gammaproteobacteria bacterium]HBW82961.1 hypothetical protein [Gammaproteobacteria bacterium]
MFELSSEIPFLWRLSAERSDGYCSVSMVVPCPPDTRVRDLTIETDVQSLSSDSIRSVSEETLEWNQEDIDLFLKLINHQQLEVNQPLAETVRIDLTDPEVVEIINVVAAAGFGVAFTPTGLIQNTCRFLPIYQYDVGSLASINTVDGFKSCIVVDIDDDDVVCVMLEDIKAWSDTEHDHLSRHDLLLVKRIDILHPDFAESRCRPVGRSLH